MTKPHNCETCGEKDPAKFRNRRKSICVKCYNKRAQKQNSVNTKYKPMSLEQMKQWNIDNPVVRTTAATVDERINKR